MERLATAPSGQTARNAAFVFLVILLASLFGILTRPVGFLAAVWPANAILLAIMVRNPALSGPAGWAAAFLGYLCADLSTGGGLLFTLWLTAANMAGAMAGYLLFMRLPEGDRRLGRPLSIVCMFMICAIAGAVAGVVGGGAARLLFGRDLLTGFVFWFTTELVNAIVVLPAILTAPRLAGLSPAVQIKALREADWRPVLALLASMAGSLLVGGPGAFAYPIPALLWCALSYSPFATAMLTLCFSLVQLVTAALELLPVPNGGDELMGTVSIRLAIALIALGPIAVASISAARDELLRRLQHAADHDSLTGTLARAAFMQRGARMLDGRENGPVAALMIDLDHFKTVNDRYGHAAGDRVLAETAATIAAALRTGDLLGRLGGEEFAVVLQNASEADARAISERIRVAVERLAIAAAPDQTLHVTASIGLAFGRGSARKCFDTLLASADKALYAAKSAGRNRVVAANEAWPHPSGRSAA